MRLIGNIVALVVLALGALWTLQGSNLIGGTVMSGQAQWVWVGLVMLLLGLIGLWRVNRRRVRG